MAITLIHGDCNKYLADCKDKQFSLGIVDVPYGIGANKMTLGNGKHQIAKGQSDWDDSIPPQEYWVELLRSSENQIIWGGQLYD